MATFLGLPKDIRSVVYHHLLPSIETTINLTSPVIRQPTILQRLGPLSITCRAVREEVIDYYMRLRDPYYRMTPTMRFGPLNLERTTFTIFVCPTRWASCDCYGRAPPLFPHNCSVLGCSARNFWNVRGWSLSNQAPIRQVKLFLHDEELRQLGNNDEWTVPPINRQVLQVMNDLPNLVDLDIFILFPVSRQDYRRWWRTVRDDGDENSIRLPTGSQTYRLWIDGAQGPSGRPRITVWYAWASWQILDVTEGTLRFPAKKLRSWPRGGGLPEIHDEASGYEHPEPDEDLIDLAHEDLGAFAGLKYI